MTTDWKFSPSLVISNCSQPREASLHKHSEVDEYAKSFKAVQLWAVICRMQGPSPDPEAQYLNGGVAYTVATIKLGMSANKEERAAISHCLVLIC